MEHSWSALSGFTNTSSRTRNKKFNTARGAAELTLVYLMNIPEDVKREAVRLVASVLRNVGVTRVERGGGGFRRMFSWIRCVLAL